MAEPINLTDETLESILNGSKPALILFSSGEGVRGDFITAFRKAVDEHPDLVFAKIDPSASPAAAARFEIGSKPVLIGWNGAEIVRRNKPWGTDVPMAIDILKAALPPPPEPIGVKPVTETKTVDTKPVVVTDATFEQEVLNYHLPVLVDYWAEWCGPCRMVAPILEKLAGEFAGQVRIAKVDVDANPGLSQAFQIRSIPTIMLIKNRTIVFSQPGALPEPAFRDLLQQLIALEVPPPEERQKADQAPVSEEGK